MSGYTDCACRDCFDIAISSNATRKALCNECHDAGCDRAGRSECERLDAYESDEGPTELDFEVAR